MDFGWWNRDPDTGKYQVHARFHGGTVTWKRKQGHHTSWLPHEPSESDWDRLMDEADRRVPRRLISPRQLADLRRTRPE